MEQTNRTKISDLDYTIAAEADIPEELQNDIEENNKKYKKFMYLSLLPLKENEEVVDVEKIDFICNKGKIYVNTI